MTSVEKKFIKSALPAQECFIGEVEDTSLAVPQQEYITAKNNISNRSLRVHRQVQLTLARRGKRTTSDGGLHLSKNQQLERSTSIPGSACGRQYNVKMCSFTGHLNGHSSSSLSEWKGTMKRPSMRVEVSPPPSPPALRPHQGAFLYGMSHRGAYTLPVRSPSTHRSSHPLQASPAGLSLNYTKSEMVQSRRAPTSPAGGILKLRAAQPRQLPLLDDSVFIPNGPFSASSQSGMLGGYQQTGYDALYSDQQSDRYALVRQARRNTQVQQSTRRTSHPPLTRPLGFPASYPASLVSTEPSSGKKQVPRVQAQLQEAASEDVQGNSEGQVTELTLEKAVSLLTQEKTEMQISAAQYIQHQCYTSSDARRMVFYLHGVPKLISLLQADCEQLQMAVVGALRNVVFESSDNKMEVKDKDGIPAIVQLLKTSRDIEIRKQLTGLLWNLSSHDLLKDYLCKEVPQTLTKAVLIPCSGIHEGENPKDDMLAHPDIFYNATGFLRNMSSAGPGSRRTMRECEFLIDSLVHYIRGTIADYKPDDKSTENCVCILHNLTYQMESELPQEHSAEIVEQRQNLATDTKVPGCFGMRTTKVLQDLEMEGPLLEEKSSPRGVEWLWSPITVRMYLSLMARSSCRYSQEAALGALQNATAGSGTLSQAMAHTIVKKEGGLHQLKKILQADECEEVKKTALSLLRNVSRYEELHSDIAQQILPDLVRMLPEPDSEVEPPGVTISLCNILLSLCQNSTQNARAVVNLKGLRKLVSISGKSFRHGPNRQSQAASTVLQAMWRHNELHGAYRKAGYKKSAFINSRTVRSLSPVYDKEGGQTL